METKNDLFADIGGFLEGVGDFAKEAVGTYSDFYQTYKDFQDNKSNYGVPIYNTPAYDPKYYPNISASDFVAQPNWYLLFGGMALLIVALFLLKK